MISVSTVCPCTIHCQFLCSCMMWCTDRWNCPDARSSSRISTAAASSITSPNTFMILVRIGRAQGLSSFSGFGRSFSPAASRHSPSQIRSGCLDQLWPGQVCCLIARLTPSEIGLITMSKVCSIRTHAYSLLSRTRLSPSRASCWPTSTPAPASSSSALFFKAFFPSRSVSSRSFSSRACAIAASSSAFCCASSCRLMFSIIEI